MRRWGLIVTLFYSLVVVALLVPMGLLLVADSAVSVNDLKDAYSHWGTWTFAGIVILGQVLLLWLSVDTTQRRLRPRTHILVSVVTTGLLMAILTVDIAFAVGVGMRGDKFLPDAPSPAAFLAAFAIPWLIWGILFYRFCRNSSDPVTLAVAWLFRGSVLELLIAVPAHVIVRRRHDCSAPIATSSGITTGIAIMLLSFGPSVLLLYRRRMERYSTRTAAGQ